jgi:hypothetical protein
LEKFQVRRLRKECLGIVNEIGQVGVDASTAQASFAMLRGLHLERQLRVASLLRQNEALAALTRAVVEANLIGLYLALDAGGLDRLNVQTQKYLQRMMEPWTEGLNPFEGWMSEEGPGAPDLRQIAEQIDETRNLGQFLDLPLGQYLYRHWYVPLSNLAIHTSSGSLGRHRTFGKQKIRRRPWNVVPRRGAIRVADGTIAALAAVLAEETDHDSTWLVDYERRQIERANIPMAIVFSRVALAAIRHMGLKGVLRLVALAPRLRDGGFEGPEGEASLEELARLIGPPGVPTEDLMRMWRTGFQAAEGTPQSRTDDGSGS